MAATRIKVIQSRAGDGGRQRLPAFDSSSALTGVDGGLVCPLAGTAFGDARRRRAKLPKETESV